MGFACQSLSSSSVCLEKRSQGEREKVALALQGWASGLIREASRNEPCYWKMHEWKPFLPSALWMNCSEVFAGVESSPMVQCSIPPPGWLMCLWSTDCVAYAVGGEGGGGKDTLAGVLEVHYRILSWSTGKRVAQRGLGGVVYVGGEMLEPRVQPTRY